MGYARSPFIGFEFYLRIVVGLDEDDIQLILKKYITNFVSSKITPGIYSIKDISKAVYTMGDHGGALQIEYDHKTKKTKLISTHFGETLGTLIFDEKPFLILEWV